jgi:hypothetical protein
MKSLFLLGLVAAVSLQGQIAAPPVVTGPVSTTVGNPAPALRSEADLNTLLGPIALYPDALIGLILPASTTPADIVLATRFIGTAQTAEALAAQSWDDSVKALTHYPDLLRWLDQNLEWTQALGDAFVAQPAEVMNAVQRLRQQARAAGTLVDTPQQRVVAEENTLLIVPAQPEVIYVPVYDPAIVYISHPARIRHTHLHFHSAYRTGPWLIYSPNWHRGHLHIISHSYGWHHPGYRHPAHVSHSRVWAPPSRVYSRPHRHAPRPHDYDNHRRSDHVYQPPVSRTSEPSQFQADSSTTSGARLQSPSRRESPPAMQNPRVPPGARFQSSQRTEAPRSRSERQVEKRSPEPTEERTDDARFRDTRKNSRN